MWKDSEFCSKRDDDSAIGDSANNSAGEESTNSRRKSSTSDDVDDLQIEPHAHLASKVGVKIPDCLLKDSEESLQNCKRTWKTSSHDSCKSKRVIRILPAATVQNISENTRSQAKDKHNMPALELKLQHLLLEMKKLRDLDRDILRKFIDINGGVDEMRWKLAESEAVLRQNLVEGGVDDDIIMTLSESRLKDWNDLDITDTPNKDDLSLIIQTTDSSTPLASMSHAKSIKTSKVTQKTSTVSPSENTSFPKKISAASTKSHESVKRRHYDDAPGKSLSYSNATYGNVDEEGNVTASLQQPEKQMQASTHHGDSPAKIIDLEKLSSTNYYRFKSPHPSPAITPAAPVVDIWVKKDATRASQDRALSSASELDRSHRPKSSNNLARKYNDRIQQQQNAMKNPNCSSRAKAEGTSRMAVRSHWPVMEKKAVGTSDFQKQRDYKSLMGLSRVSSAQVGRQKSFSKTSDSAGSLNSSSSLTSSSSSSSVTSPTRNPVSRSNSSASKWSRLGLRRSSKSININTNNNAGVVIVNNNYKPNKADPRSSNDVMVKSYKQRTSTDVYKWVQSQDDVTFL